MTQTSITKKTKSKLQGKDIRKKTPKVSKHRIITMLNADQNFVRPRRLHWHPGNSYSDQNSEKGMDINKKIDLEMERYRYKFDENYRPIRTISSFPKKKPIKTITKENIKVDADAVKNYFRDYCEGTSLHGLRYVGAENVSLFERFFWISAFMGAIGFAAYFITNIYNKWELTPIIVGINPEFESISNIPFPAITICNMNQARKSVATKIINENNQAEKILLDDICNKNDSVLDASPEEIRKSKDWMFIKNFIVKVSQPCRDLLVECKWQGYEIPCSTILNSALTDEGVCCTFNRVATEYMYHNPWTGTDFNITFPENNINWNPETGYPPTANNTTWPFRAAGAGEHIGLTIVTNVAADQYYCSSTSSVGLKIRLHSPVESPMMADYGFFMHPRKEVRVAIRPTMDEASTTIYKIPIDKRQCFFSVEKLLFFYRTYTKLNCELECLSNYTLGQCGCLPFYLPKNENTTICDKTSEKCYKKAKADMDIFVRPAIFCGCLPACNEIQYGQDHSLGDISIPSLRRGKSTTVEPSNLIILHFFYQTTQFRTYEKSELFGFTEFLSNSGGLLGLFLGFSFLSAVEIFYHLTLRLWCVYYRKHRKESHGTIVYPYTS